MDNILDEMEDWISAPEYIQNEDNWNEDSNSEGEIYITEELATMRQSHVDEWMKTARYCPDGGLCKFPWCENCAERDCKFNDRHHYRSKHGGCSKCKMDTFSKENFQDLNNSIKQAILSILIISLKISDDNYVVPLHSETLFYKLPKEILCLIFYWIIVLWDK